MESQLFGVRRHLPGIYEATLPLSPEQVDATSQDCGRWCAAAGWPPDLVTRTQLVLEEQLMNIHDHGFDDQQRRRDVVSIRLRHNGKYAELTVWDHGRPPPSLKVAAGDAVLLLSREQGAKMGDTEIKVAETTAGIVGRQMEQ